MVVGLRLQIPATRKTRRRAAGGGNGALHL